MNNNSPVKYIYSSNTSIEIPYLDTCITLKDGKWHTKMFIKPNAVASYIHARSGHSAQTKRNMIRNEAIRSLKICSLPSFFEESLIEIMERFKMRGYSQRLKKSIFTYLCHIIRHYESSEKRYALLMTIWIQY
ncbi:hypothetical protein GJ496_011697 [Pomphorhynchus laevis]|nr:hypothetical protein GJ496_011697 [Pomphorhynchus laevis]